MNHPVEAIIIGGSYAGLSAAMALARALRRVVVIDSGKPCNRFTPHAHNFITHDGATPDAIRRQAKAQVLAYPTVEFWEDKVTQVHEKQGHFQLKTASGRQLETRQLLFATGVKDVLPEVAGVLECWGKTLIHCPYCHGYEVKGLPTGVWMNHEMALEYVPLIQHWAGEVVLLTEGEVDWETKLLHDKGVTIYKQAIKTLHHQAGQLEAVELEDGTRIGLKALYHPPKTVQHCTLAEQLGCALTEAGHIEVDGFQATTVAGIYAAGDCTTPFRSVAQAVAQGNLAGAMMNKALL